MDGVAATRSLAAEASSPRPWVRQLILPGVVLALFVVSTMAAWFRLDPTQRGTLWAEDGHNFISDDVVDGLGAVLFRPIGGYVQLIPRLIAATSNAIANPEHLAQAVTVLSCAAVGVVSALLYLYGRTQLRTRFAPFVLAAVPPLIPTAPQEALGTMNNLHSFLLLLVPFAVLFVPRSWWSSVATACVLGAIVLSETQAMLFAPLLLAGIRDKKKWPVVAAFVITGIAQVATYAQFPRQPIDYGAKTAITMTDVVVGFVTVPLTTAWTTRLDEAGAFIGDHGITANFALAVVCVAAAIVGIVAGTAAHRWLIPATVFGAAAVWAGALLVTPSGGFVFADGTATHVAAFEPIRYATVTSGFLLIALAVIADAFFGQGRTRRLLAILLTAAVVVPLLVNYQDGEPAARSDGPTIRSQLSEAREACETGHTAAVRLRQSPDRPPWSVTLSCASLKR